MNSHGMENTILWFMIITIYDVHFQNLPIRAITKMKEVRHRGSRTKEGPVSRILRVSENLLHLLPQEPHFSYPLQALLPALYEHFFCPKNSYLRSVTHFQSAFLHDLFLRHLVHSYFLTCSLDFKDRYLPDNLLKLKIECITQTMKKSVHACSGHNDKLTSLSTVRWGYLPISLCLTDLAIFPKALNCKGSHWLHCHHSKAFYSTCVSDFMGILSTYHLR